MPQVNLATLQEVAQYNAPTIQTGRSTFRSSLTFFQQHTQSTPITTPITTPAPISIKLGGNDNGDGD